MEILRNPVEIVSPEDRLVVYAFTELDGVEDHGEGEEVEFDPVAYVRTTFLKARNHVSASINGQTEYELDVYRSNDFEYKTVIAQIAAELVVIRALYNPQGLSPFELHMRNIDIPWGVYNST